MSDIVGKEFIVVATTENGDYTTVRELIRCVDCKWYYMGGATCMFWDGANSMCAGDYCSRAERKDNG